MRGVAEDFVAGTEDSRRHGARAFHPAKSRGNLVWSAGRNRVGQKVRLSTARKEIEDGLLHTDVGFDACDENVVTAARGEKRVNLWNQRAKAGFLEGCGVSCRRRSDRWRAVPKPIDVLLGDDRGEAQYSRGFKCRRAVGDHAVRIENRGEKPLLHVDDEERGSFE